MKLSKDPQIMDTNHYHSAVYVGHAHGGVWSLCIKWMDEYKLGLKISIPLTEEPAVFPPGRGRPWTTAAEVNKKKNIVPKNNMIDALGAQCRLVEDILMHGGLRTGWTKTCRKERDPLWGIGRSNTYLYIFFAQHGHSTASIMTLSHWPWNNLNFLTRCMIMVSFSN